MIDVGSVPSMRVGATLMVLLAPLLGQCPGGYGGGPSSNNGGTATPSGPSGPSGPSSPSPSGPSTPGPTAPGSPTGSPDGPRTGGPAARGPGGPTTPTPGPAAGAPGLGGGRRGVAITISRGETSKKLLQIDWDHPVYTPEEDDAAGTQTRSVAVRKALPLDQALKQIAGDDPRPLLVLRECYMCKGSDIALLSRELDNDRTLLLTNWFHCVKLPANVSAEDHPFHALFPDHSHLFLAQRDGSARVDFTGQQTQQQLWHVMGKVLKQTYDGSPETSVKELMKLLAQFDVVDEKEARLLMELDQELERNGASSSRVAKLQAQLKDVGEERKELLDKHKKLSDLRLKDQVAAAGK